MLYPSDNDHAITNFIRLIYSMFYLIFFFFSPLKRARQQGESSFIFLEESKCYFVKVSLLIIEFSLLSNRRSYVCQPRSFIEDHAISLTNLRVKRMKMEKRKEKRKEMEIQVREKNRKRKLSCLFPE